MEKQSNINQSIEAIKKLVKYEFNTKDNKTLIDVLTHLMLVRHKNKYYTIEDIKEALKKFWVLHTDILLDKKITNKSKFILKLGNSKLHNTIILDLPSGITCKGNCSKCYAKKSEALYKNTRVHRICNYIVFNYFLQSENYATLQRRLNKEIKFYNTKTGANVIRFHSSGDFFSNQYYQFIKLFTEYYNWAYNKTNNEYYKQFKFYTYTKTEYTQGGNNFNIVNSLIDNKFINYGNIEHIQKVGKYCNDHKIPFRVCSYGFNNPKHCMNNCDICTKCSTVLFKQH